MTDDVRAAHHGLKGTVCMVQYNSSRYLTRVDRAARTLADDGYRVVLIALKDEETPAYEERGGYVVKRVTLASRRLPASYGLRVLRFLEAIWQTFVAAWREDADVYDARDAYPLLVCHAAALLRGATVVYDSDELATGRNWAWASHPVYSKAIRWYEGFFARRSAAVITSDFGRADVIERIHRVERPTVVLNVPESFEMPVPDAEFRAEALGDGTHLLLYQGVIIPNRGLKESASAMHRLPECRLAFIGYGSLWAELARHIEDEGLSDRVRMFEAMPFDRLLRCTAAADIGLVPIVGSCLSYVTAAPNKLFEYMMTGLPVVASDLPDMARVVREARCGTLIGDPTDPDSIADAVRTLLDSDESLTDVGSRGREAALRRYNWDAEKPGLLAAFERARSMTRGRGRG